MISSRLVPRSAYSISWGWIDWGYASTSQQKSPHHRAFRCEQKTPEQNTHSEAREEKLTFAKPASIVCLPPFFSILTLSLSHFTVFGFRDRPRKGTCACILIGIRIGIRRSPSLLAKSVGSLFDPMNQQFAVGKIYSIPLMLFNYTNNISHIKPSPDRHPYSPQRPHPLPRIIPPYPSQSFYTREWTKPIISILIYIQTQLRILTLIWLSAWSALLRFILLNYPAGQGHLFVIEEKRVYIPADILIVRWIEGMKEQGEMRRVRISLYFQSFVGLEFDIGSQKVLVLELLIPNPSNADPKNKWKSFRWSSIKVSPACEMRRLGNWVETKVHTGSSSVCILIRSAMWW